MDSSRTAAPKPMKAFKNIAPKVDTGVARCLSPVSFTRQPSRMSHQSSKLSRESSRISRDSTSDRSRPSSAGSTSLHLKRSSIRPSSFDTTQFSAVKLHKLGKMPSYLKREQRPASVSSAPSKSPSKSRSVTPTIVPIETEVAKRCESCAVNTDSTGAPGDFGMKSTVLATLVSAQETDQIDAGVHRECPPSEASTPLEALLVANQQELEALKGKFKQLEAECNRQKAEIAVHEANEKVLKKRLQIIEMEKVSPASKDMRRQKEASATKVLKFIDQGVQTSDLQGISRTVAHNDQEISTCVSRQIEIMKHVICSFLYTVERFMEEVNKQYGQLFVSEHNEKQRQSGRARISQQNNQGRPQLLNLLKELKQSDQDLKKLVISRCTPETLTAFYETQPSKEEEKISKEQLLKQLCMLLPKDIYGKKSELLDSGN